MPGGLSRQTFGDLGQCADAPVPKEPARFRNPEATPSTTGEAGAASPFGEAALQEYLHQQGIGESGITSLTTAAPSLNNAASASLAVGSLVAAVNNEITACDSPREAAPSQQQHTAARETMGGYYGQQAPQALPSRPQLQYPPRYPLAGVNMSAASLPAGASARALEHANLQVAIAAMQQASLAQGLSSRPAGWLLPRTSTADSGILPQGLHRQAQKRRSPSHLSGQQNPGQRFAAPSDSLQQRPIGPGMPPSTAAAPPFLPTPFDNADSMARIGMTFPPATGPSPAPWPRVAMEQAGRQWQPQGPLGSSSGPPIGPQRMQHTALDPRGSTGYPLDGPHSMDGPPPLGHTWSYGSHTGNVSSFTSQRLGSTSSGATAITGLSFNTTGSSTGAGAAPSNFIPRGLAMGSGMGGGGLQAAGTGQGIGPGGEPLHPVAAVGGPAPGGDLAAVNSLGLAPSTGLDSRVTLESELMHMRRLLKQAQNENEMLQSRLSSLQHDIEDECEGHYHTQLVWRKEKDELRTRVAELKGMLSTLRSEVQSSTPSGSGSLAGAGSSGGMDHDTDLARTSQPLDMEKDALQAQVREMSAAHASAQRAAEEERRGLQQQLEAARSEAAAITVQLQTETTRLTLQVMELSALAQLQQQQQQPSQVPRPGDDNGGQTFGLVNDLAAQASTSSASSLALSSGRSSSTPSFQTASSTSIASAPCPSLGLEASLSQELGSAGLLLSASSDAPSSASSPVPMARDAAVLAADVQSLLATLSKQVVLPSEHYAGLLRARDEASSLRVEVSLLRGGLAELQGAAASASAAAAQFQRACEGTVTVERDEWIELQRVAASVPALEAQLQEVRGEHELLLKAQVLLQGELDKLSSSSVLVPLHEYESVEEMRSECDSLRHELDSLRADHVMLPRDEWEAVQQCRAERQAFEQHVEELRTCLTFRGEEAARLLAENCAELRRQVATMSQRQNELSAANTHLAEEVKKLRGAEAACAAMERERSALEARSAQCERELETARRRCAAESTAAARCRAEADMLQRVMGSERQAHARRLARLSQLEGLMQDQQAAAMDQARRTLALQMELRQMRDSGPGVVVAAGAGAGARLGLLKPEAGEEKLAAANQEI